MDYNQEQPSAGTPRDETWRKRDLDELCSAIGDNSQEHEYYLDIKTGEILFLSEYLDVEEVEKMRDRINNDPDRYERIPKGESHEVCEDMVDFITTVKNERRAELLEAAINGKGAFRQFKDVLLSYPEEKERQFQFKDDGIQEQTLEQLGNIDLSLIEEQVYGIKC